MCDIEKTATFSCFVTWPCINNFVVLLAHMSDAKNIKNSKIQLCFSYGNIPGVYTSSLETLEVKS